ncbi:Bacterial type II/III secretion system short domain protein [Pirellulimonas nuda]|uniref:Bacterial type II/III secretion system short domain protein n=1 Tax=Pirellulimonas nuda TaxID=2528009 RepID=A0A518D804_9BACT|nr:secretin N-terminal domain-containing protein [Pirellulimonas nuda]QDU87585.1 Bacterial type II/III secretion system short domain protein [Pirellulimonas nuda]
MHDHRTLFAILLTVVCSLPVRASAEAVFVQTPDGATSTVRVSPVSPGQPVQVEPGQPAKGGEAKPAEGEANKQETKEGEDAKKEGDEKKEEGKDGPVKRPSKPPRTPDPREFDVRPDKTGRVQFGFTGQPWPDVLQWLASVSNLSLDWQELPSDYLNLSTQRAYTIAESRDLINRHLQARGYGLFLQGEVLSVFKLDKIDPSFIPRVEEDELYDRQPHDIVKVSFALPKDLEAKQVVEDLKQVLSPNAKVLPLTATGRVLAIDAVANLRMVSAVLNDERLANTPQQIPRRFVLKHARAEKVIDTLYVVLGLDPASRPSQMELQIQQQKMQLMTQMQGAGKDVSKLLNKDGPPVFIAFNRNENSVLVNAPREQMEIVERAIEYLDVPPPGSSQGSSGSPTTRTAETYQLKTIEPKTLQTTLEEIGDLDPLTELRADNKAKILFARASLHDHATIERMISQLDGARERIEVFYIRRRPVDAVAGTVMALIGGQEEEKKKDNNRNGYFYSWYDQPEEEDTPKPTLRVDADIENNRLIVRGADEQIEQVRTLLVKLGEIPGEGYAAKPMQVLDPIGAEATDELLEKLRALWPSVGGGVELKIDDQSVAEPKPAAAPAEEPPPVETPPADRSTDKRRVPARVVSEATRSEVATAAEPPAVTITVTPDGRIVLTGSDPDSVAKLEELVGSLAPQEERFKIFQVDHVSAFSVWLNLTEFFEEDMSDGGNQYYDYWSDTWRREGGEQPAMRLSKRPKLRLIYDTATNTILAANASAGQLAEIERLIKAYDIPAPDDSVKSRRTATIKIRYSQAGTIAAALKEVYRDLLSSRDKEFDDADQKAGSAKETTTVIRYGGGGADSDDSKKKSAPVKVGFQGALSVGVDEISNVIIVSAQEELFDGIVDMIQLLDSEAKPNNAVQVRQISGAVQPESLQKALADALGTPWIGGKPQQAESGEDRGRDNGNSRRDRDRGDRGGDRRRGND